MSDNLIIIGAGGHAKVVLDAALAAGKWQEIVLLDDFSQEADLLGYPIIGSTKLLGEMLKPDDFQAVVAIGDNQTRADYFAVLVKKGFTLPAVVHPAATVSPFAEICAGVVVCAGAVVNAGAVVGRGTIINTGATVDHDCEIGFFAHISPGAHLAGNTVVGDLAWMGIGSCTRQGSNIGIGAVVGAGAAVIEDIPAGITAIGTPARELERKIKGLICY